VNCVKIKMKMKTNSYFPQKTRIWKQGDGGNVKIAFTFL
jgi:hypothetical protein